MAWLGFVLVFAPMLVPGILGAWFVASNPEKRARLAVRITLGGALACVIAYAAFMLSPWVQAQNVARDAGEIAAVQPYVFGVWAVLVAVLCFGIGGWLADRVRKGGAVALITGLIVLIVVPSTLFVATLLVGCFFAGACF
jgi:hypothetical membrane protein